MDVNTKLPLLGGMSPADFMKRHWQKKPLLVRQAWPGVVPPLTRPALFALAASDAVESRLVLREGQHWRVRQGPLPRRALPALNQRGWTLLLQGLDLHLQAAHAMLQRFRFVPDARLDDLMLSWASDEGGVGPHLDSYDVFLLQVQGRRRWRVGRAKNSEWVVDAPHEQMLLGHFAHPPRGAAAAPPGGTLKLLRNFKAEHEWLLEPRDMLYLPPLWGHDGVAVGGDCMTCSIGFRAPAADELALDLLQRLGDEDLQRSALYRDRAQPATATPAALPPTLLAFAQAAVDKRLAEPRWLARALGESLTEPKPQVWFEGPGRARGGGAVWLSARTRMLYDEHHIFINGDAFDATGTDARMIRRLADERVLGGGDIARLSAPARALLDQWIAAGWAGGAPS